MSGEQEENPHVGERSQVESTSTRLALGRLEQEVEALREADRSTDSENTAIIKRQAMGAAAEVVKAYLAGSTNSVGLAPTNDHAELLYELAKATVRGMLDGLEQQVIYSEMSPERVGMSAGQQQPAVEPKKSIREKSVICVECGKKFKILTKKHLAIHNLTPQQYKEKWGLKKNQPLVAKALSRQRSQKMQDMQLWKKRKQ